LTTVMGSALEAETLDHAVIVVSELVTNAVRAGTQSLTVSVGVHTGELLLEVGTALAAGHDCSIQTLIVPEGGASHRRRTHQ
jgi:hypothetical protein